MQFNVKMRSDPFSPPSFSERFFKCTFGCLFRVDPRDGKPNINCIYLSANLGCEPGVSKTVSDGTLRVLKPTLDHLIQNNDTFRPMRAAAPKFSGLHKCHTVYFFALLQAEMVNII